jgi:hypothetical protein
LSSKELKELFIGQRKLETLCKELRFFAPHMCAPHLGEEEEVFSKI